MGGNSIMPAGGRGRAVALVLLIVLGIAVSAAAQDTGEAASLDEVQAEFSEAFEAAGDYTAAERDEALEALDATLERLDQRIARLEDRVRDDWSNMSEAARDTTSAALADLRQRRNRLSQAYGALSQGAGTAWDDLVAGVQNGWKDVERAWDEAATALRPEDKEGN